MQSIRSMILYRIARRTLAKLRARNLPLPEMRKERDAAATRIFKFPPNVGARTIFIGELEGEWLTPPKPAASAVLYLHGGAYTTGSIKTHRAMAARLALAVGSPVLIINYSLAPERPFPHGLNDALIAYGHLLETGVGPIALAGDSAGGGLCVALTLALQSEQIPPPAALALMSPWTDLSLSGASWEAKTPVDPYFPSKQPLTDASVAYRAGAAVDDPFVSPLFADLAGLPPTLIHVGEREALLDDSIRFAAKAKSQGVPVEVEMWPGMWHVWQLFQGKMPEADHSLGQLGAFLRRCLRGNHDQLAIGAEPAKHISGDAPVSTAATGGSS